MIVAGAVIFGRFLTVTRLPFERRPGSAGLRFPTGSCSGSPVLLHHRGVRDGRPRLPARVAAIFYPIVTQMGYDPIWFGQVITIVTTMGLSCHPSGYVLRCCGMAKDIPLATFSGRFYYIRRTSCRS